MKKLFTALATWFKSKDSSTQVEPFSYDMNIAKYEKYKHEITKSIPDHQIVRDFSQNIVTITSKSLV